MTTIATTVEFTPANEVEVQLNPSRPSKAECIALGYQYFTSVGDDSKLDAMLEEFGGVLIRRSLKAFANYANRTGDKDVAKFVFDLRDDIVLARAEKASA